MHKENYSLTTRGHSSFCRVVSRALLFDTENKKLININIFIYPNQRPGALSRLKDLSLTKVFVIWKLSPSQKLKRLLILWKGIFSVACYDGLSETTFVHSYFTIKYWILWIGVSRIWQLNKLFTNNNKIAVKCLLTLQEMKIRHIVVDTVILYMWIVLKLPGVTCDVFCRRNGW